MIYLDNSATTKPSLEVMESFVKVSIDYFANPSSLHSFGGQSESLLTKARLQCANLLSVKQSEIYFTSGGTEGNNLAIKGVSLAYKSRGRHLITSAIEHPSVMESFKQLEALGFDVTYIPVGSDGRVKIEELEKSIRKDTILVSIMHVNNEVGAIQPISEVGELLKHFPDIKFHVDFVQGIGKVPLNINSSRIDLCTISGHKFHGLKGTGLLFVRDGVLIEPLITGGGQEKRIRSGTENVAGIVSLSKAMRLIFSNFEHEINHLRNVSNELRKGLEKIEGVIINTPKDNSAVHILNFSIPYIKPEVFVHALEKQNIFVSTTSACSSKQNKVSSTLLEMGIPEVRAKSAIRISLSYTNTLDEINKALIVIDNTIKSLRKVMK